MRERGESDTRRERASVLERDKTRDQGRGEGSQKKQRARERDGEKRGRGEREREEEGREEKADTHQWEKGFVMLEYVHGCVFFALNKSSMRELATSHSLRSESADPRTCLSQSVCQEWGAASTQSTNSSS